MKSTKYQQLSPESLNYPVVNQNLRYGFFKVFFVICVFSVTFYSYLVLRTNLIIDKNEDLAEQKFIMLKNLIDDDQELKAGNNNQIFFIESHLEDERNFKNVRQACRYDIWI